jgi:hypothetical protein
VEHSEIIVRYVHVFYPPYPRVSVVQSSRTLVYSTRYTDDCSSLPTRNGYPHPRPLDFSTCLFSTEPPVTCNVVVHCGLASFRRKRKSLVTSLHDHIYDYSYRLHNVKKYHLRNSISYFPCTKMIPIIAQPPPVSYSR